MSPVVCAINWGKWG